MHAMRSSNSVRATLAEHFAELCCGSSILANQILQAFPDYRRAKANPADPFWKARAPAMLARVEQAEQGLFEHESTNG